MASYPRTNPRIEQIIYEQTIHDVVYTGEYVKHHSRIVTNSIAWLVQLGSSLHTAEVDLKALADSRHNKDTMEIDIAHQSDYYKILPKNTCTTLLGDYPRYHPLTWTHIRQFQYEH
jgi:hypothetical protein